MYDKETEKLLNEIAAALKEAGFEPGEQLIGYAESGNPLYITRLKDAREKIAKISKADVRQYLAEYKYVAE